MPANDQKTVYVLYSRHEGDKTEGIHIGEYSTAEKMERVVNDLVKFHGHSLLDFFFHCEFRNCGETSYERIN